MATLDGANAFHVSRGNTDWDEHNGQPLLNRAQDYISAFYSLKPLATLSDGEQTRYDTAVYLLAYEFQTAPAATRAAKETKIEKLDGSAMGLGDSETTYFDAPVDPYPIITALLAPLTIKPASIIVGRLGL